MIFSLVALALGRVGAGVTCVQDTESTHRLILRWPLDTGYGIEPCILEAELVGAFLRSCIIMRAYGFAGLGEHTIGAPWGS